MLELFWDSMVEYADYGFENAGIVREKKVGKSEERR
jgi:hypothetical protein